MKKLSLVLVLMGVFSSSAFASASVSVDGAKAALSAAYESDGDVISDIYDGNVGIVAQESLNVLVAQGVQALRDSGSDALADQYEHQWNSRFSTYLTSRFSVLDLGDHNPLSKWLADFYVTLVAQTKGIVKSIRIISDINTLNYALAVVIQPNGSWRTRKAGDRVEYRKHFIPFANIATYWITIETCKHFLPDAGDVCDQGAEELEHLMGRYVAPDASDWIFTKVTGDQNIMGTIAINPAYPSEAEFVAHVLAKSLN